MAKKEKAIAHPFTLRAVYLHSSQLRMSDNFDPMIPGQQLVGQFRQTGGRISCQELTEVDGKGMLVRSCIFIPHFDFRYFLKHDNEDAQVENVAVENVVAELSADIAVDYIVNLPNNPPEDLLAKWGSSNVLLHAWPYWREYCHSTLARMNLPVTLMPMINLQQATKSPINKKRNRK